jgi:ABC-type antimicrobial peptide transport system permease subunit
VLAVDKNQPVTDVRTAGELLDQVVFSEARFNLALFSVFAALGLALAVIGVYGVVSNSVAQRRHEIGVRMALGAGFGTILRMVLADGFRLVALGMALGVGVGLAGARLLASQVWRVSPLDPVTFTVSALVLLLVGMQACFWPARRAARVDPVAALRHE